jgi:hypothetical protein
MGAINTASVILRTQTDGSGMTCALAGHNAALAFGDLPDDVHMLVCQCVLD